MQYNTSTMTAKEQAAFDAGLRSYMLGVYNYMMMGLAVIGAAALFINVSGNAALENAVRSLYLPAFLALIGLGFFSKKLYMDGSATRGQAVFWIEVALWSVVVAGFSSAYNLQSVIKVFFMTSALFGAISLYGYTTNRNLTPFAQAAGMIMLGLILLMLVNIGFAVFGGQPLFAGGLWSILVSVLVIVLVSVMAAWETQNIKQMYYALYTNGQASAKFAVLGASMLLSSFVVLFIHLLSLFGGRD